MKSITLKEVCNIAGVTPETYRRWLKENLPGIPLPYTPKGKHLRFYEDEVIAWIKGQREK